MKPLPLPLRVAAGLAVTAVDRARHLPEKLAELPVTVVSQALQLSMRVQQQVTELAIKGDDALSSLRPVEETPEWATFDEDTIGDRYDATPAWTTETNGSRSKFDSVELSSVEVDDLDEVGPVELPRDDPAPTENPAPPAPVVEAEDSARPEKKPSSRSRAKAATNAASEADAAPVALPNYAELTLPQLRARLRRFNLAELDELVSFERAHADRPDFVGMLTRRMSTLRDQQ